MSSESRLQAIKEILESHCGKHNRVSAGVIGPQIGINEGSTHVKTRGLILKTIKEFNLPIAADTQGYYLIKDANELQGYLSSIDGRISEMENRKNIVQSAFEKYYKTKV